MSADNKTEILEALKALKSALNEIMTTAKIPHGRYIAYYRNKRYSLCVNEEVERERVQQLIRRRYMAYRVYELYQKGLELPLKSPRRVGYPIVVVAARGMISAETFDGFKIFLGHGWDAILIMDMYNIWRVTDMSYHDVMVDALVSCARMPLSEISL